MIRLGMSTSCVFPLGTDAAFGMSADAGFDGVEVMVTVDSATQNGRTLARLAERHGQPVLAVHAPVLPFTRFVFGSDLRTKLVRSAELATELGATTVVVHPPFRWESRYARRFVEHVETISAEHGVEIAVENMFPWRVKGLELRSYLPSSDPTDMAVSAMTLDFSHAALAGRNSLEFVHAMGPRLRHVHLTDGTVSLNEAKRFDEHLVPGRGTQPVAEVLEHLAGSGWSGSLVAEVATRKARAPETRIDMLRETVRFARAHLAAGERAAKAARAASRPAPRDADTPPVAP